MAQRREPSPLPLNEPQRGERLQRVLADAGIAARRVCETMIETGRVRVNGRVCDRLPAFVDPRNDRIEVDGQPIARTVRHAYIMMNKPTKVLTMAMGPEEDRPVALLMIEHPARPRLVPVGGLDFDSSGLLLFTNDGEVINRLTHARYGHARVYQAKVKSRPTPAVIAELAKGVYVYDTEDGAKPGLGEDEQPEGGKRSEAGKRGRRTPREQEAPAFRRGRPERARKVQLDVVVGPMADGNCTLEITAKHARDEEIVKALTLTGHPVRRLHRVAIGPLTLRDLPVGRWRELTRGEVLMLTKGPSKNPKAGRPRTRDGGGVPGDGGTFTPVKALRPSLVARRRPRVIGGAGRDERGDIRGDEE